MSESLHTHGVSLTGEEIQTAQCWIESLQINKAEKVCVLNVSKCYIPGDPPRHLSTGRIRVYDWKNFQVGGNMRLGCFGVGFTTFVLLRNPPEPFNESLLEVGEDRLHPHLYAFKVDDVAVSLEIGLVNPSKQLELEFYDAKYEVSFDRMVDSFSE